MKIPHLSNIDISGAIQRERTANSRQSLFTRSGISCWKIQALSFTANHFWYIKLGWHRIIPNKSTCICIQVYVKGLQGVKGLQWHKNALHQYPLENVIKCTRIHLWYWQCEKEISKHTELKSWQIDFMCDLLTICLSCFSRVYKGMYVSALFYSCTYRHPVVSPRNVTPLAPKILNFERLGSAWLHMVCVCGYKDLMIKLFRV